MLRIRLLAVGSPPVQAAGMPMHPGYPGKGAEHGQPQAVHSGQKNQPGALAPVSLQSLFEAPVDSLYPQGWIECRLATSSPMGSGILIRICKQSSVLQLL